MGIGSGGEVPTDGPSWGAGRRAPVRPVVARRCRAPGRGGAVAVTITATDATTGGYLSARAASTPVPDASNLNFRPGAAVANSAIVALSADGAIDLYSSSA